MTDTTMEVLPADLANVKIELEEGDDAQVSEDLLGIFEIKQEVLEQLETAMSDPLKEAPNFGKRGRRKKNSNFDDPDYKPLGTKVAKTRGGQYNSKRGQYNSKRRYTCKKCGEIFSKTAFLQQHRKEKHPRKYGEMYMITYDATTNRDKYVCVDCKGMFDDKEAVQKHYAELHGVEYTCSVCDTNWNTLYEYSLHLSSHETNGKFKCAICEFESEQRSRLFAHIKSVHLNVRRYQCRECKRLFDNISLYNEHLNFHVTNQKYMCVVCGRDFEYQSYLTQHQIRHHTVHIEGVQHSNQCPLCRRMFAKPWNLKRHHTKVHETVRPDADAGNLCDICGKSFAHRDKLKLHYRIHTGEKPYQCSYCSKRFTKSDYLKLHERIHSGEKPYECEYCGKCFNQPAPLKVHTRLHTGERPFVCSICGNGFASKGSLNTHTKACIKRECK